MPSLVSMARRTHDLLEALSTMPGRTKANAESHLEKFSAVTSMLTVAGGIIDQLLEKHLLGRVQRAMQSEFDSNIGSRLVAIDGEQFAKIDSLDTLVRRLLVHGHRDDMALSAAHHMMNDKSDTTFCMSEKNVGSLASDIIGLTPPRDWEVRAGEESVLLTQEEVVYIIGMVPHVRGLMASLAYLHSLTFDAQAMTEVATPALALCDQGAVDEGRPMKKLKRHGDAAKESSETNVGDGALQFNVQASFGFAGPSLANDYQTHVATPGNGGNDCSGLNSHV